LAEDFRVQQVQGVLFLWCKVQGGGKWLYVSAPTLWHQQCEALTAITTGIRLILGFLIINTNVVASAV
jgi:hypothetical protein